MVEHESGCGGKSLEREGREAGVRFEFVRENVLKNRARNRATR